MCTVTTNRVTPIKIVYGVALFVDIFLELLQSDYVYVVKVKPLHFFMPTRARGDFQSNINQRAPLFLNANTKKCEKIIAAFVWRRLPKQDHKSCFWSSINQSMFIHLLLHIANPSLLNKVFCVLLGKTCDMNISFVD